MKIVLLNVPVSPRKWPVARPDALGMVKVGNSECGLAKLTPLSRMAAMVGALSGVTACARKPSGTNRIRLCGACAAAGANGNAVAAQANTSRVLLNDMAVLPIIFP